MVNDKQIMSNILNNVKGECDLMMHGAIESATPEVHSAFMQVFNETMKMQNDIYNKMSEKGWYPANKVEKSKIEEVKQKFQA